MKKVILSAACLILSFLANNARAVLTTWDPQGTTGSNPETTVLSGTWESANWSTSETGQATPQAWVEGTAAVFAVHTGAGSPAFTITMNSNHTVAGFYDGPLTPDPCTVTVSGPGIITLQPANLNGFAVSGDGVSDPGYLTLNVVLAGGATAGVCPEDNSGQTFLNGTNTYSGGTYLGYSGDAYSSSIINFNNAASFGTSNIYFLNSTGGALVVEGSSPITITNQWVVYNESVQNLNIVGNPAGVTFSGPWVLTGGTPGSGAGIYATNNTILPVCGQLSLGSGAAANNLITISGLISGTNGFNKYGVGMLQLTKANTYGKAGTALGSTWISNGWLVVANTNGSATGVSSVIISNSVTPAGTGTLTGSGTISGSVTNFGNISATNMAGGPAILTTGAETWEPGSAYVWATTNTSGAAGMAWDEIVVTNSLTINSTFTIDVTSLTAANLQGALVAFDNTQNYSWPILTASGGISGFNAANVTINTSAFANALGSGAFTVSVSSNTMYLNFGQPPTLTVSPATFSVASGHTAYITASATGSQLSYFWTFNNGSLTPDVAGQGTATLTISPARDADAGTYTVTVSNPIGSVSGSSLLTVVDPAQYSAPNTTFTMNFSGPVGQNYRIWSTSNPALPVLTGWNFMGSFQFTAGVNTFMDNNASSTAEYYCITVP